MACLYLMVQSLDKLTYYMMGGERPEQGAHGRPGSIPRSEEALPLRELNPKIRDALAEFAAWLVDDCEPDSLARFFLMGVGAGAGDIDGDACKRSFRRNMIGASVGVYRRLVLRLTAFPLRLWVVAEPTASRQVQEDVAQQFLALPECCLGVFGRKLKELCPSPAALLSPLGLVVIGTWLRSQHWSIYDA